MIDTCAARRYCDHDLRVMSPPGLLLSAPEVSQHWPLTGVTIGERLVSHPSRVVIKVRSDQGDFAAKLAPALPSTSGAEDRTDVIDHLANRGFPHAPLRLRTRRGSRTHERPDSTVTLFEWVPGLSSEIESHALWAEVGSVAAALNAHKDFSGNYSIPVDRAVAEVADLAKETGFGPDVMRLLPRASNILATPSGLIHGEINPSNVRRRADGTVVLVDWDQAGDAATALEVGYPLITTFITVGTHVVDVDSARAWFSGYAGAGGWIDPSQVFAAGLFHALRYMWFAEVDARWERIQFAVRHEGELLDLMASGSG